MPRAVHPIRIMPYTSNECVGLKKHQCITIRSKHTAVAVDRAERIALKCPTGFPHVVGWDAISPLTKSGLADLLWS